VEHLDGEWSGSYESRDTDRHGSIQFVLEASRDTAYGDVLMVHRQGAVDYVGDYESLTLRERSAKPPRVVEIRFVVVEGDRVFGSMEPYRDPECGCQLRTEFEGVLDEDTVRGTFVSEHLESGRPYPARLPPGSMSLYIWLARRRLGALDPFPAHSASATGRRGPLRDSPEGVPADGRRSNGR
jgi:hypothetical protein